MDLPQYEELHVVSDLHIGGKPGFQILRETARLAGFIDWVGQQSPEARVGLVLNGDVFDSLAEEVDGYLAFREALPMLERIFEDPQFRGIWDALARFVARPHRTLVIVIGNHDIELAFPPVQRRLRDRLAGEDGAARARIEFSTMGAGYACQVAGSRVFCTHGNEVDAWNYIRYEDLARAARRLNAARSLEPQEWQPNAGTKLVKDVMNAVKRKYAWIDLLKPEVEAAVGVLVVLDPGRMPGIQQVLPLIAENVRGAQQIGKRLSAEVAAVHERSAPRELHELLGPNLRQAAQGGTTRRTSDADEMLLAVEMSRGRPAASAPAGTLGTGQLVWDRVTGWLRGVDKAEALRRALADWLAGDKTFDPQTRDGTFNAVTESVGTEVDIIVTGHTHLERAIDMGGGRAYFNTGTWIRLIGLGDRLTPQKWPQAYEALENGTMGALDDAGLVLDRTSAVRIRAAGARAIGELLHVQGDGTRADLVQAIGGRR